MIRCTTLRQKTVGRQVTLSTDVSGMSISSNNHLFDNFFIGVTNRQKLFARITISRDSETLLSSDQSYIRRGSLK